MAYDHLMGEAQDVKDHPDTQLAGEVVPIRPGNSPANNAGKQNQKQNEKSPNPNMLDPKNANIVRIYG